MTDARSNGPIPGGQPDQAPAAEGSPSEFRHGEVEPGEVGPGEVGPGEVRPGDVRPPSTRQLERPPGERYASGREEAARAPRWDRALLFGLGAALVGALAWVVAGGVVDLSGGLVVLAAVAGWGIGVAVRLGAWASRPHEPDGRTGALAIALGILTWLLGTFLVYLYSQATLPESALTFVERLAATAFLDWLTPQLVPLAPIELLALVLVGWYAAR